MKCSELRGYIPKLRGREMREQTRASQTWNGRTLKVVPVRSAESTKRISDIVARRAFQISEGRGFVPGHEMEDWQRAKAELVNPICGGWTVDDRRMIVTAPAAAFKEGGIEICVEPRRLAIFGRKRNSTAHNMAAKGQLSKQEQEIVRTFDLPFEVDPSAATARFDHCMLEISLPRAHSFERIPAASHVA